MFSYNRFSEQFKILLYQNYRRHGMILLIFVLYLLFIHYEFIETGTNAGDKLFNGFGFCVTLAALFHSIDAFGKLRTTNSGIYYLMVPATIFEKYLAALLYSSIVTFIVYLSTFCFVHLLTISVFNLFSPVDLAYAFPNLNTIWEILKDMFFFQSLYFFGSILFRKNPFAKTTLIIVGSIVLVSIISGLILKNSGFGADVNFSHTYSFNGPMDGNFMDTFPMFDNFKLVIDTLIVGSWILPFLCWTAAFFRLKTVQI
jgi:hypothetical protein